MSASAHGGPIWPQSQTLVKVTARYWNQRRVKGASAPSVMMNRFFVELHGSLANSDALGQMGIPEMFNTVVPDETVPLTRVT